MTRPLLPLTLLLLGLAACDGERRNPPTEPADPIQTPDAPPPAPVLPGGGPATFVGRWAANPGWCANTTGPEQAIEITILRFDGYENSCAITSLEQASDGYDLTLACQAEGQAARERVRLSRQGERLRMTWLNRNDAVVLLTRCPAAAPPAEADPAG
ncbi:hypothetical protein [Brevundimonas sp. FT23042]|uniref:hypothetical protein n=1 Tax=Brevundimonas sp. FT23042 TaxID=3393749 RepID=UPI003B587448